MKDLLLQDKIVLEKLAIKINDEFFGGELPEIIINTEPTKKSYGHFWKNRWKNGEDQISEINISPVHFGGGPLQPVITLHHEMIHLHNSINDVNDASGKRHNKKFKQACDERDLYCIKVEDNRNYATPHENVEDQSERWQKWYKKVVKELKLEEHFQFKYVPNTTTKAKRVNTAFICDTTGERFYLPDKLAKQFYDVGLELTSPYEPGGSVTPADDL